MEAVKRAGSDPPVLEGAGYNEVYTALAGYYYALRAGPFALFRKFSDGHGMVIEGLIRYFSGPGRRIDEKTVNFAVFFRGNGF